MLLIQIFIIAFAAYALSRAVARYREGSLSRGPLVFWVAFWVVLAVVVLQPQSTSWFASLIGVGRGVDAAVYLAVILLYYLIFRIFLKIEKIEHDITLLVRHLGISDFGQGDSDQPDDGDERETA